MKTKFPRGYRAIRLGERLIKDTGLVPKDKQRCSSGYVRVNCFAVEDTCKHWLIKKSAGNT